MVKEKRTVMKGWVASGAPVLTDRTSSVSTHYKIPVLPQCRSARHSPGRPHERYQRHIERTYKSDNVDTTPGKAQK